VVIDLLVGNLFRQSLDTLAGGDIGIEPDVTGFRSLNFSGRAIARLIDHGYSAAVEAFSRAQCLPRGRAVSPRPLPRTVSGLSIVDELSGDSTFIHRQLGLAVGESLDVPALRSRLRFLSASRRFTALWLYPRGTGDSVSLTLTPNHAPVKVLGAGAVYDNDLGGKVWLGAVDRRFGSYDVEASALTPWASWARNFASPCAGGPFSGTRRRLSFRLVAAASWSAGFRMVSRSRRWSCTMPQRSSGSSGTGPLDGAASWARRRARGANPVARASTGLVAGWISASSATRQSRYSSCRRPRMITTGGSKLPGS
jgi:hypothetical protein